MLVDKRSQKYDSMIKSRIKEIELVNRKKSLILEKHKMLEHSIAQRKLVELKRREMRAQSLIVIDYTEHTEKPDHEALERKKDKRGGEYAECIQEQATGKQLIRVLFSIGLRKQ